MTNEKYFEAVRGLLLGTPDLIEAKYTAEMDGEQILKYAQFCKELIQSPHWQTLLKEIELTQKSFAVAQAENYEQVTYSRAIIISLKLLNEMAGQKAGLIQTEKTSIADDSPERHDVLTPSE